MSLEVVILAAGQGTRMRSGLPKVLHTIGHQTMLAHVVSTAKNLNPQNIHIVFGHDGDRVRAESGLDDVNWVEQATQAGTGHAVRLAMSAVQTRGVVLVMYGDVPLIQEATLQKLISAADHSGLALLTATPVHPEGLGRIIRNQKNAVVRIVEQNDASAEELAIREINTGFIAAKAAELTAWLARLNNKNAKREYYLTDCVAHAVEDGVKVSGIHVEDETEILGVNSKLELARAERALQQRQAENLMQSGVSLKDPARFDLRGRCTAGVDCEIDINVVLEGEVTLGDRVSIGPNCTIKNSELGNDVTINANTVIEGAQVADNCALGPYARIRPGTELASGVRIGNFVEIKKSLLGKDSKANHLAYVGDSEVGVDVNIGAGVITCNYDGVNKHKTEIGHGAFIGSNSALVAPVRVGDEAVIAAGSVISKNAPDRQLTVARGRQTSIEGWRRPMKKAN